MAGFQEHLVSVEDIFDTAAPLNAEELAANPGPGRMASAGVRGQVTAHALLAPLAADGLRGGFKGTPCTGWR
jgi:hypothetical protein